MTPQGSSVIDAAYFEQLTTEINGINVCSDLQALVDVAFASLQAQVSAIESQLGLLEPIEILLELPTDLSSVITWIGNLVTGLIKPIYAPYLTYIAQITQLIAAITALTTAIENAAERLGNCSITVPPLVGLVVPAA